MNEEIDRQREINKIMITEHTLKYKLQDIVINLYNRKDIYNEKKNKISKIIFKKIVIYKKKLEYFKSNFNIY